MGNKNESKWIISDFFGPVVLGTNARIQPPAVQYSTVNNLNQTIYICKILAIIMKQILRGCKEGKI